MAKVKVGVFGARRGRVMIDLLFEHPNAQLVAVCDKFKPALESCSKKAGEKNMKVEVYEDFEEFFQCDMDAVVLANYATEHAPYAIRLLESGRHVLSECLATQTMSEAVALVEAVEKTGKIYNFAENVCFFKNTFEMYRRYRRGDVGEATYCEGEYVHPLKADAVLSDMAVYNYGDKNHWRFRNYSTFYCSHSVGPILYITGLRPVRVVGLEVPPNQEMLERGYQKGTCSAMMIELSNGAVLKNLMGGLRKHPYPLQFQLYGTKGCMETDRWKEHVLHVYTDNEINGVKGYTSYECEGINKEQLAQKTVGHGGSDFYATDYFINNILGDNEAQKYSINIYQALDMCIPGIMGYRSILGGNIPVEIPNFRIKEAREPFRYDNACTDPKVAGISLLPVSAKGEKMITDDVYDKLKKAWEENNMKTPYFSQD